MLDQLPQSFFEEVVQLSQDAYPIIVHGGGPAITSMLQVLQHETVFTDGVRVTTKGMVNTVEMVLSGKVNKFVVKQLQAANGLAVGISGVDAKLLTCRIYNEDFGYVGEVEQVDAQLLKTLCGAGYIPVVSPLGIDEGGETLNINGDEAAAAIAAELSAELFLISDVPGIYSSGIGSSIYDAVSLEDIDALIESGVIAGGMIPKVKGACRAIRKGVKRAIILNGLERNGLSRSLSGESIGTTIREKGSGIHASNGAK